jgi:primosomal protein N'
MAKSNSFLNKKSAGILKSDVRLPTSPVANPASLIKKSSLCLTKKPDSKIAYGTSQYDFAAYATKRDLEEAAMLIKHKHTQHLDKANKKKAEDLAKARLHKELMKRKRILEAKKQQDEVLDDLLYGGMKTKEKQSEKEKGALDGLQALREDSISEKNEEINVDMEEIEDDAEK